MKKARTYAVVWGTHPIMVQEMGGQTTVLLICAVPGITNKDYLLTYKYRQNKVRYYRDYTTI